MQLLERESWLYELDTALNKVIGGEGRAALISGEAGIGKTALVEQFVRERKPSVRVLWGACDALFTPRPLGPLHDMAPQMQGNLQALLHPGSDRSAIFSAMLGELAQAPVIAVFEDIHWADEATLDLLRFLGRRIARTRALLVLTYRDDELRPRHPLRSVLGDLSSSPATRRIPLPPLSPHAVRTLVGERAIDACALHRQTGGNPFFVTEVLASAGQGVPPTVRDAVLARAAHLAPSALPVLQAAAVIGPRIEPWLLAEITQADEQAIEACLASGMVIVQGEMLAFRHEIARQTMLESISPLQKAALHRTTLAALKAAPGARDDVARLAHHAEGARDQQAVLCYAPAAARQAAAASAHREAAALYALAHRFAHHLPPTEQAHLLERYAQECYLIDLRDLGVHLLREALAIWRQVGNPQREGATLAHLANLLIGLGYDAEADQCARSAIAILEAHEDSNELVQALRVQSTLDMINHNLSDARCWAEKSLALADRLENRAEHFLAHNILGSIWMYLEYEHGRIYLEQNLAAASEAGRKETVAHAYAQLGSISSELHHFRQAERYLEAGLAYVAQHDLERLRLYMLAWQAWTLLHLGAWHEAAEAARMVLRDGSTSTTSQLMALITLGRLGARRGDAQAQALLDEALGVAKHMRNIDRLGPLYTARAEAAWLAGARERAANEARIVFDLAASKEHSWFAGELAFWLWRASGAVDLPSWAATPFALQMAGDSMAAAAEWERLGCPYEQASALADGDPDAQRQALRIFARLGAQPAIEHVRRKMRSGGALRIPRGPRPATRENPFGLTPRQMDILRLLSAGLSNAEIAARLYISPKTVDHHVSAVLSRLDVPSRKAASALIQQHPLLNQI